MERELKVNTKSETSDEAPSELWMGAVYFIQVGGDGLIKIGYTRSNPALRVRSLQQSSPHVLTWIGFIPAEWEKEGELHKKFAEYRFRGEWFHPVAPLVKYINRICPGFDSEKARRELLRLDVLNEIAAVLPERNRDARWKFIDCLEESGVERYHFFLWREGQKAPTKEFIANVRAAIRLYREMFPKAEAAA